jgi:uncharacterized protein YhaN
MKITDVKIDGFGVWRDLSLRNLSPEITVLYGPNEAGKTTLMQFLRSVLYGISPVRRERYLPPLSGGRPGGWLKVLSDDGPLTVSRYADRSTTDVGKVTVTTADDQEQGDRLLREALEQVDEPTYNNIFAVGLHEVQELGTLSDTAAAQWIYRLTSGLDRISVYDVIHLLGTSRLRLLGPAGQPSEIRSLVSRHEQLRGELDELVVKGRRWAQSAVKLRELADEVDRRQAEVKKLAARARQVEVAIGLKPLWTKREKIDDQLQRFADLRPLEEGTLESLDDLNKRIEEHERQRDIRKGQRQQLRDEAEQLGINDILVRNNHRLEALAEQQEWLQALERLGGELADEVAHLEARLESENQRLSHEWTGAGKIPPRITTEVVEQLGPHAKAIDEAEEEVSSARRELEHRRVGEHQFRTQIESAMTTGDKLGLPKNFDEAADLVARLRSRQQVEERLDQYRRQADRLQEQGQDLVEEQVVPLGLFSWLLALFMVGFMMLTAWWLLPAATFGKYGGWLAALGIGGSIFAWLFKYFAEDSAADRFDACHRQVELVAKQIEEAREEQRKLDRELPVTEGSVNVRLQHAEEHLAELERMLPVESKRREAAEEITAVERRLALAEENLAAATANWQGKLRALGLPEDVSPANLVTMAGQCERLGELEQRIENRRDDMARRQRELTAVSKRITSLAEETGLRLDEAGPLQQLDHLIAAYHEQQHLVARRRELRERAKELKAEEARHAQAAVGYRHRREALFEKCGVEDEQGLRQLAARLEEADQLRKGRAGLTREIAAAIGRHGTEADFAPLLAPEMIGRLDNDWESFSSQLEAMDRELKVALEQRGAMVEQQRALAADRSLAEKQIELDVVAQQLAAARTAWRERAAVSLMLERIRHDYELHRQPETLREATEHFRQLTSGKYTRIWTPLANDILLVDTADGQSLPVEVLSRGTREQLFVSLRLALVAAFARRGIHLPMILDDVLVNFDAERTRIAVAVLRDFARQGHQLLMFTCHEHLWRLFQELKVDARRLPDRFSDEQETDEPLPEEASAEVPELEEEDYVPQEDYVPEEAAELPPEPDEQEETQEAEELSDEPDDTTEDGKPASPVDEAPEAHPAEPGPEPQRLPEEPVAEEVEYWWTDEAVELRGG